MSVDLRQLARLEAGARRLDPTGAEREALTLAVTGYAESFLRALDEGLTFTTPHEDGIGITESGLTEEPLDAATVLGLVRDHVDAPALNPASPGHMAYIPGGGLYPSALGDYLAAVGNRYAGVHAVCPGAVRMEQLCLRWMADLTGLPGTAGGDLTSGGSLANLSCIVTAREARGVTSRHVEKAVVYLTGQTHHCVDRALRLAGLGECVVRRVPMDDRWRMRPEALDEAVAADRRGGLRPWLVVASAGTTDTGAVDPLQDLAEVAARRGLWYHVDAAYGGFFLLTAHGRRLLRGIERADSLVLDPHKGLFLPFGTGAALVRDRELLRRAHAYEAAYLQDARDRGAVPSPAEHSPELSRHFRGLRLWLPLKLFGLAPFRDALEEKLLLARYFHERISGLAGFEAGPAPELSVATYRAVPAGRDPEDFNRRLLEEVLRDGRVFLSSTMLDGRFTLRLALLHFRTHRDHVDRALAVLDEAARRLAAEG